MLENTFCPDTIDPKVGAVVAVVVARCCVVRDALLVQCAWCPLCAGAWLNSRPQWHVRVVSTGVVLAGVSEAGMLSGVVALTPPPAEASPLLACSIPSQ